MYFVFFFFKQKTAYEMRISDWSSDVCSSDLTAAGEANNQAALLLNVGLADYADLEVSDVEAPAQTIDDPARVRVEWTVTNIGTGEGFTGSWTDRVIVSRDAILGNGDDIVLGEYLRSEPLAVGANYRAGLDLILPPGFYGRYTLFVQSDAKGEVFENGADTNRGVLAGNFDVSPIPWADLYLISVDAPDSAVPGIGIASGGERVSEYG